MGRRACDRLGQTVTPVEHEMLKLVSWNIAHRSDGWRAVVDSDVDIALLQEAGPPPAEIASRFDVGTEPWETDGAPGYTLRWRTALVGLSQRVRVERIRTARLADAVVGDLPVSRMGSIAAGFVCDPDTLEQYAIVSMYAPWEVPHNSTKSSWMYADASVHRLISDISALIGREAGHHVLASGDLNILRGYGDHRSAYWAGRYGTIFERFSSVGLEFVGPQFPNGRQADPWPGELPSDSRNVPTFWPNKQLTASATRQLDFVFASR